MTAVETEPDSVPTLWPQWRFNLRTATGSTLTDELVTDACRGLISVLVDAGAADVSFDGALDLGLFNISCSLPLTDVETFAFIVGGLNGAGVYVPVWPAAPVPNPVRSVFNLAGLSVRNDDDYSRLLDLELSGDEWLLAALADAAAVFIDRLPTGEGLTAAEFADAWPL